MQLHTSKSWLAGRLVIFFIVVERIDSSEHRPTLRRLFVSALEERFTCACRALFGVLCFPLTGVPL
jgi:hypothetical protein